MNIKYINIRINDDRDNSILIKADVYYGDYLISKDSTIGFTTKDALPFISEYFKNIDNSISNQDAESPEHVCKRVVLYPNTSKVK